MKYKYSLLTFLSNLPVNFLIIVQIFVLFVAANISLASVNSRSMLYTPLKPYLEQNGFFIMSNMDDESIDENIGEALSIIDRDISVAELKSYTDRYISFTVLPDEMFDSLDLPLQSGEKFKSTEKSDLPLLIVSANEEGAEVGKVLHDNAGNGYQVAAKLTDLSYFPSFHIYSIDMTYEEFYDVLDINTEQHAHFYTSESQIKNVQLAFPLRSSSAKIVTYNSEVTEEEINSDFQKLMEYGKERGDEYCFTLMNNKEIVKRSEKLLSDDFKKMLPPVASFGIIVLIGVVSCAMITSKNAAYKLAILYCCGAGKRDCIKISSGNMMIVSSLGLLAAFSALFAICSTQIPNKYGLVFNINNVILSLIIFAVLILISISVPMVLFSRNSPYDALKNEKQE